MSPIDARTLFIVNPKSAGGRTRSWFEAQRRELKKRFNNYDVQHTSSRGHGEVLARNAVQDGVERVVAVGGDGTANEVANGFMKAEVKDDNISRMGILPSGTGGDFARTLGWSKDVGEALDRIQSDELTHIDLGYVRFNSKEYSVGSRYFINIASFGLSGEVDAIVATAPKILGAKFSYVSSTLRAFATYTAPSVTWQIDDDPPVTEPLQLMVAANGQFFGGGMHIAPSAAPNNEALSFVKIGDVSKKFWLQNALRVYKGDHVGLAGVSVEKGKRLSARSSGRVLVDIDGEQVGDLPIEITVLPRALPLIATI